MAVPSIQVGGLRAAHSSGGLFDWGEYPIYGFRKLDDFAIVKVKPSPIRHGVLEIVFLTIGVLAIIYLSCQLVGWLASSIGIRF